MNTPSVFKTLSSPVSVFAGADADHLAGLPQNFLDDRVPKPVHLGVGKGAFLRFFVGPQFAAAVNDGDLVGKLGQKHSLFDRRVAAADDDDPLCPGKKKPSQVAQVDTPRP